MLPTLSLTLRRKRLVEILGEGLTYDDVLLVPQMASALPRDVSTKTRFCRGVDLQVPIASAAMDTVTESRMAVALAQQGGIGIVHKNLSIEKQVGEVDKVKRSANGIIRDPVTLPPNSPVSEALKLMREHVQQNLGIGTGVDVPQVLPEHLLLQRIGVGQVAVVT